MCGINGIYNFDKHNSIDENQLVKMRDELTHRGPDDSGIYIDRNIGLGHRRLSIIDLSKMGHQPFISDDKNYSIVFNGEIFNYKEFEPDLVSKGYKLRSNSDTEILLYLFIEYGEAVLDKLNGMFAFAIWDKRKQKLFIARDRVGVKPLFYYQDNEKFLFASEAKAIFKCGVEPKINEGNITEWLIFRFVAGEETLFKGVKKLLPGHYIEIEGGNVKLTRWWNLGNKIKNHEIIKNPIDWYRETFHNSVAYRMISDVPVGVLLSGGLDSTSIVAALKNRGFKSIETFNVGFKNFDGNEANFAKNFADQMGYPFHSIYVEGDDLKKAVDISTYMLDEPLTHQNDPQLVAISNYAHNHVKVLLSGEGSDEFNGGYVRYKALTRPHLINSIRFFLSIYSNLSDNPRIKKLKKYLNISSPENLVMWNASSYYPEDFYYFGLESLEIDNPYRYTIRKEASEIYPNNIARQTLYYDQHTYLCSLNDRNDRATMAASIECRDPFLDYKLMEGVGTLSDNYLFKGKKGKNILLKSMGPYLPKEIINNKKIGFSTPFISLLSGNKELKEKWDNLLDSEIFNLEPLNRIDLNLLKTGLLTNDSNYQLILRQLFFFDLWYKAYFRN